MDEDEEDDEVQDPSIALEIEDMLIKNGKDLDGELQNATSQ